MDETFTIQGYGFAQREEAVFGIFNDSADLRRSFSITRLNCRGALNGATVVATRDIGALGIARITAVAGGRPLVAAKHSLASTDLPSQVKIVEEGVVTISSATSYRVIASPPSLLTGLTLPSTGRRLPTSDIGSFASLGSATQGIVLAAGEGLALTRERPGVPVVGILTVTFRVVATGAAFTLCNYIGNGVAGRESSPFALMNESGSGISLEVVNMDLTYAGDPVVGSGSDMGLRILLVRDLVGGDVVTPVQHDLSQSIPASLVVRQNTLQKRMTVNIASLGMDFWDVTPAGPAATSPIRGIGRLRNVAPYMSAPWLAAPGQAMGLPVHLYGMGWNHPPFGFSMEGQATVQPIVLRPGWGLAVMGQRYDNYSEFYFEATILHTPPPAGGGGLAHSPVRSSIIMAGEHGS